MIVRIKLIVTLRIVFNALVDFDASIKVVNGLSPIVTFLFAVGCVEVVDVVFNCPLVSRCGIVIVVWAHLGKHTVDVKQFLKKFLGWWLGLRQSCRKLDVSWMQVVFRVGFVVGPIAPIRI